MGPALPDQQLQDHSEAQPRCTGLVTQQVRLVIYEDEMVNQLVKIQRTSQPPGSLKSTSTETRSRTAACS